MKCETIELSIAQLDTVAGSGVLREVRIIREVVKEVKVVSPAAAPYPNTASV